MATDTATPPITKEATGENGKPRSPGTSRLNAGRGSTTIADTVVAKVAGIAAREVDGVYELGGGMSRALGAVTEKLTSGTQHGSGVSVEVGETETAIDLTLVIFYGESIPSVCERVRDNIVKRVEGIVGLSVAEVNISVNDLHFAADDKREEEPRVQ